MRKIFFILLFFFLIANSFANENYQLTDITEGSRNAKIKIYSYQSLTCPHCATFHHKVYPLIKKDYIDKAILTLNERERTIIKLRKLREKSITLDELGQMLKISKERVRQIETKALEKLKVMILKISQQNKEFFI